MNYRIETEAGEDITNRHGNNRYRYYTDLDLARFWAIKKSRDTQLRVYLRDETKTLNIYENGKPIKEKGESYIPALKCPQCKRINKIVNQCGCDPANMPTRLGVLYAAPDFNLAKTD